MSDPHIKLGWRAELNLNFEKTAHKTVLASRTQSGPLTVQRPFYPEGDVCHLYLLHPPGGVVGGDELFINTSLTNKASVLITTPGATKFYRGKQASKGGQIASQIQTLRISKDCAMEWFPQENIFFDKTNTHLSTKIELDKNARFMGWEINCYGRPASKELFESGKVMTRMEVYRDGEPLILDRLLVDDVQMLQSKVGLNQYPCFGTFLSTNVTQELLESARNSIEDYASVNPVQIGLTLLDDLLVVRCLGPHSEQVSTALKLIWSVLRPDVMQRSVCLPRIWST